MSTDNLHLTTKALQILGFIGLQVRVHAYDCGRDTEGTPTESGKLLWQLGDALHNLGHIHEAFSEGRLSDAHNDIDRQVSMLECFIRDEPERSRQRRILSELTTLLTNLKGTIPIEQTLRPEHQG